MGRKFVAHLHPAGAFTPDQECTCWMCIRFSRFVRFLPSLTNWEIFSDLNEKTFENFSANPTTNQLGTFRANNKWVLKNFLSAPPTNQLGNFLRFWQSNMKKFHQFFKRPFYLLWIRGAFCGGVFDNFSSALRISPFTFSLPNFFRIFPLIFKIFCRQAKKWAPPLCRSRRSLGYSVLYCSC